MFTFIKFFIKFLKTLLDFSYNSFMMTEILTTTVVLTVVVLATFPRRAEIIFTGLVFVDSFLDPGKHFLDVCVNTC